MSLSVRFVLLSLALVGIYACDFTDSTVCDVCESSGEVACTNAIRDHCVSKNWNEAACDKYTVGCPFALTTREGGLPSSPCVLYECVGSVPDNTACLASLRAYCNYEIILEHTAGSDYTADPQCSRYKNEGCTEPGSILDCDGQCVMPALLNDGTCQANMACAATNDDGGDCAPSASPTPMPTPSPSASVPSCCMEVTAECCSCQTDQSRHGFCRDCREGSSEASEECCNSCSQRPNPTRLSVSFTFGGQSLDMFTDAIRRAMKTAFATICSQDGINFGPDDIDLVLEETNKQGVTAQVSVDMPSEEAAQDANGALQNEDTVLAQVNQAIVDEGEDLVLTDMSYQDSTVVVEDGGGKSDDKTTLAVVLVMMLVVLPGLAIGAFFGYRKYQENQQENNHSPQMDKQVSNAILVASPALSNKKHTMADEHDAML